MPVYYKNLKVWQESYDLVLDIYKTTDKFPESEIHNFIPQLRRAATSIPTNIAEGASSLFDRNFVSHLSIAYASGKELETFLMLARDLDYIENDLFDEIFRKLDRLNSKVYNLMNKVDLRLEMKKNFASVNVNH